MLISDKGPVFVGNFNGFFSRVEYDLLKTPYFNEILKCLSIPGAVEVLIKRSDYVGMKSFQVFLASKFIGEGKKVAIISHSPDSNRYLKLKFDMLESPQKGLEEIKYFSFDNREKLMSQKWDLILVQYVSDFRTVKSRKFIEELRHKNSSDKGKILIQDKPRTDNCLLSELYEASDQNNYLVSCLHCNHPQRLRWEQVRRNKFLYAWYECTECGKAIQEKDKVNMLQTGMWKEKVTGSVTRGFHLNSLYSPFISWIDLYVRFHECKASANPAAGLKTFTTMSLAENGE